MQQVPNPLVILQIQLLYNKQLAVYLLQVHTSMPSACTWIEYYSKEVLQSGHVHAPYVSGSLHAMCFRGGVVQDHSVVPIIICNTLYYYYYYYIAQITSMLSLLQFILYIRSEVVERESLYRLERCPVKGNITYFVTCVLCCFSFFIIIVILTVHQKRPSLSDRSNFYI